MKFNLKPYIILARPANMGLVAFVILLTSTFFDPYPPVWRVLLAIICVIFITAAGNAYNDICDIEIDKINKPKRPLPSGLISPEGARGFMIIVLILGNLAGWILGFWTLVIALFITTPLLFWYARRLRHVALVGNIVIAFLSSLAFLFAALAFGDISIGYVPAVLCFAISLIREIIKDLEDLEGDSAHNSKTLPVVLGETPTRIVVGIMILMLLPIIPIPYVAGLYGKWFFFVGIIGVGFPLIIIMVQLFQIKRTINYHQMAIALKILMVIGIATIFIGRF
ncbi:MAG: geranylgeranylglycerol-phosphate geranylgeranyltransferase [Candidatus Marinimicrobia bacterium]|nr:geranylgeranylglycerol-phosphate geranylgeranyltransferase [Candidatus Neomarinimicrobiota bacterium]